MQKGDESVTDFNGKGVVRVAITDRRENAQSQSRVMYRVWPPLKGGNNETWYDADWFEPAPPNAGGNATERSEGRVDHNVGRLPGKDVKC